MAFTPMMEQYLEIKKQYQDCILFFRLGDFYEMFFEDALTASKVMEVTLTGKNCGAEERAPMCGVPYHSVDTYIAKLIEKGYRVAICEQVEDPATAKGIVKREVVRVVTPGTVTSSAMLSENENNYLISLFIDEEGGGIAFCDLSTGEIYGGELNGKDFQDRLVNELVKLKAKEVLMNETPDRELMQGKILSSVDCFINILPERHYHYDAVKYHILEQFHVQSLQGIGLAEMQKATYAIGALLTYLFETQKHQLTHFTHLNIYDTSNHMSLDKATLRNLELTENIFDKKVQGSLLGVLDKTNTAMGGRKIKQWIREPLNDLEEITERLNAVEVLVDHILMRNDIKESLKQIYDLERLAGRVACGNLNGKDLIALKNSIRALPEMKYELQGAESMYLQKLESEIDSLEEIFDKIDQAIVEEPPYQIKEGGLIKEGYSNDLDEMKLSIKDGQLWISSLEGKERERTGIKNLKVSFNKVFGYYIEVTKSNYDLIPDNYIRKQTLVNCERFITPELKEVESLVLNAETKINQMEYELFVDLKIQIQEYIPKIQKTAAAVAALDVLISFAEVSAKMNYVKPEVHERDDILIEKGRHPVIEQTIKDGIFVSNDTYLDREKQSMLLITGPNMAGKSTYMRQTALIILMAQIGCFVPCEKASIGVVDKIYTRIGAADNLSQGQSTFFVEMSELAYILNTSTQKSLVILDEIGRGTSTYDGLSIAWAAIVYLCNENRKIRTLFATHYHELTVLEDKISGVQNLNVDVQEENGSIVFLHKIVKGSASRSYGLHVAKIAGVPNELLDFAKEKLIQLESSAKELDPEINQKETNLAEQLSFFNFAPSPVVEKLKSLNLMDMTPSQAFHILEELQNAAK